MASLGTLLSNWPVILSELKLYPCSWVVSIEGSFTSIHQLPVPSKTLTEFSVECSEEVWLSYKHSEPKWNTY